VLLLESPHCQILSGWGPFEFKCLLACHNGSSRVPTALHLQLTPDITVAQSVSPSAASLVPGNQPVFTFSSTVSAAAGSGRVNSARLDVSLSAGLARTGDITAQPDGEPGRGRAWY
jgi:hypothetical protein